MSSEGGFLVFRCKPPKGIAIGKFQLTIWGHFLLDFFGQIWTQWNLRYILGHILVIFDICHFLMIPGQFEYFSKKRVASGNHILLRNAWPTPGHSDLVLGLPVSNLHPGPIDSQFKTLRRVLQAVKSPASLF